MKDISEMSNGELRILFLRAHLNLTIWFATIIAFLVPTVAGWTIGDSAGTLFPRIVGLIMSVFLIVVYGWVLRQKNRSLWWLLLWWFPIGFILFLFLKNKSEHPFRDSWPI